MHPLLRADLAALPDLLASTLEHAAAFLQSLPTRPAAVLPAPRAAPALPGTGVGAAQALQDFVVDYAPELSGSAGPRYFGFVTGGATPAALAADWLVSAFDQNLSSNGDSVATHVERHTIALLAELLGLPAAFTGSFVTGATMSNFVSLAVARQWAGRQLGADVAQDGWGARPPLPILSAAPHSSVYKAVAMLGLGRSSVRPVAALPGREAVDVAALAAALHALEGQPAIVVASAGTVNTTDFDDLAVLGALKQQYPFWLHVDAAFGAFAACSPRYQHLLAGVEFADSVTVDAHKWLNVPYDAAMQFVRREHQGLQTEVFQNRAAYLGPVAADDLDFNHLTPENSRRFRALPAWLTLMAYGRAGYQEIVERNCDLAQALSRRLAASAQFALLAPTRLNIVCFTLRTNPAMPAAELIGQLLARVRDDGRAFFTPTVLGGQAGIRAAFSNWRTEPADVELAWQALTEAAAQVLGPTPTVSLPAYPS
jgi:glutamate/tyrosine decarboxylase-like PLP-dependent enzyme